MIDHPHFESNHSSTHEKKSIRNLLQFQGIGRIPDSRIFMRNKWQFNGTRTHGQNSMLEIHGCRFVTAFHLDMIRPGEFTLSVKDLAFPHFGHASETIRKFSNYLFLPLPHLSDVNYGLSEADAMLFHGFRILDHLGKVQESLGRDAPDVEANSAKRGVTFNNYRVQSKVSAAEGGGVTSRPRP